MSDKKSNEPRAHELLPPAGDAPVDPKTVMRSDDSLEPEVETRKIGIRRVHALGFGGRMYTRLNRRSVGNSRRFWRKIEADDPFLEAPARPSDMPLEIYPGQRLDRMSGSMPKPQPDVARAYPPSSRQQPTENRPAPRPKPQQEAKRPRQEAPRQDAPPPRRAPEPTHTPEPRPAPTPRVHNEPEPEPAAVAPQPPAGRRLPPKPPAKKRDSGRIRTSGRRRMPSAAGANKLSAAEIRERKRREREAAAEGVKATHYPAKPLDEYREFVQMMEIQQAAHEAGEEIPTAFADTVEPPRPKPKGEVRRPKQEAKRPKPSETKPPTVNRTPPKPAAPPKPAKPIDRSPSGAKGASLDDLFGGAQEGRVRIGRRAKPKVPGSEGEGDS